MYHALKRSPAKKKSKSSGRRSKSPRTKRSRSPHYSTVKVKQVSEWAGTLDGKLKSRAVAGPEEVAAMLCRHVSLSPQ